MSRKFKPVSIKRVLDEKNRELSGSPVPDITKNYLPKGKDDMEDLKTSLKKRDEGWFRERTDLDSSAFKKQKKGGMHHGKHHKKTKKRKTKKGGEIGELVKKGELVKNPMHVAVEKEREEKRLKAERKRLHGPRPLAPKGGGKRKTRKSRRRRSRKIRRSVRKYR